MLCENCKANAATMHVVSIVNGVKKEQHLCAECAKKGSPGIFAPFIGGGIPSFSVGDMFMPAAEQKRCSACGMTSDYLRQSGKLGCARCYSDLRAELTPTLRRVHGRVRHAGRTPQLEPEDMIARERKQKLAAMQAELEVAVGKEQYEKAAQLRDEIRRMKEGA